MTVSARAKIGKRYSLGQASKSAANGAGCLSLARFEDNLDSIQFPPEEPQPPPYLLMNAPSFRWGSLNADDFSHALEGTYSEVVHWRLNNLKYQQVRAVKTS